MFEIDFKINRQTIYQIYGRNTGTKKDRGTLYIYKVSEFEYDPYIGRTVTKSLKSGEVYHERVDGLLKLVKKIIEKAGE